ncbi:MAG: hypothetical protein O4861_15495 [Trichodesmium sp. St16_bin4-tuft]|nr:hypothetical protein [Trichodesmium erythraeum GBRTRLIN201]MDE5069173.1 hypothetical protein [Trichodesmium sp. St4_bin8_1]MDE5071259.1 hypothetical protein [Trichodesmium sp. St5_bin8]MDE5099654.1 hypothetical protein [Trichodesmium sp. St16_bin4-tuft]MDT9339687.1 hypothetical protein [Trichodesmium erythraeum 21-75]
MEINVTYNVPIHPSLGGGSGSVQYSIRRQLPEELGLGRIPVPVGQGRCQN